MKPLHTFILSLLGYSFAIATEPALAMPSHRAIAQFEQNLLQWDTSTIPQRSPSLPASNAQVDPSFVYPVEGAILTSGYGWRWGRLHQGIDLAAPLGTPVTAAAPGRVTYAGWNSGGYGYLVEIEHADGSLTRYAHNARILVKVGATVEQRQLIAQVGSTGYSTGPHLHFELHTPGRGAVNPMGRLAKR